MPRIALGALLALGLSSACGPFRVGPDDGVKPIAGNATVSPFDFNCLAQADCMLLFERDVTVIRQEDYAHLDGLPSHFKGVELEVRKLQLRNAATGAVLMPQALSLNANGQLLVTEADLPALPKTVTLDDCALFPVRQAIAAREAVVVHVSASATLASPPAQVTLDYEVQPTLLVGL